MNAHDTHPILLAEPFVLFMKFSLCLRNHKVPVSSKHHKVRIGGKPHHSSSAAFMAVAVNDRDEITPPQRLLLGIVFHTVTISRELVRAL
jgi:hypothetical protein